MLQTYSRLTMLLSVEFSLLWRGRDLRFLAACSNSALFLIEKYDVACYKLSTTDYRVQCTYLYSLAHCFEQVGHDGVVPEVGEPHL